MIYETCEMKVFGIGLSRTGTKSLSQALSILGYRSAHFDVGIKAIKLTADGLGFNYSHLEGWDSLTDIPAAAFYKDLDRHFPRSKFILTVRESQSWLASCEKHYSANRIQYLDQHNLEMDQVLRLRRLVYGQETFDSRTFGQVYDKYIQQVQVYFQDRQTDLLIANICAGEGWQPLCRFLNKPIPDIPFPHKNQSGG